jgi:hypothetical protein
VWDLPDSNSAGAANTARRRHGDAAVHHGVLQRDAPVYIGGVLAGATTSKGLRTDWLISFEPTPGTVAFFGYGSSLAKAPALFNAPGYKRTSDGFFVKLAYMIRR